MDDITKQLMEFKDKIDKAKIDKAQAEGRLAGIMEKLKKDFGCSSLEEAERFMTQEEEKIASMEAQLKKDMERMKNEYFSQ